MDKASAVTCNAKKNRIECVKKSNEYLEKNTVNKDLTNASENKIGVVSGSNCVIKITIEQIHNH